MILLLILILVFLFFCVLTFFFTKTWRALHVVMAFLVFAGSLGLLVLASLSAKTHTTWRSIEERMDKRLTDAVTEGRRLAVGDPADIRPSEDSALALGGRLSRVTMDRGRYWALCTPRLVNNQIVVNTVPENVPPERVAAVPANITVYAFKDLPVNNDLLVPAVYLGEFRVSAVDGNNVTLSPTLPLDANQQALVNQTVNDAASRWTLFEMMPVDGHTVFADVDASDLRLDDTRDQAIFGAVDDQSLATLFERLVTESMPEAERAKFSQAGWQQIVESYLRDGKPATEQDQRDQTMVKVKFLKPYKIEVDSEAAEGSVDAGLYDPSGRAVATRLRAGNPVEFQANQIGIFDAATAEQLIRDGICERIANIYVRPLNDYAFAFHDIQQRMVERAEDIRRAERDIAALESAQQRAEQQIAYRTQEKAKLTSDLTKTQLEREKVTQLAQQLEQQRTELVGQLSELYRTNLALDQQLNEMNRVLTEAINKRTEQAARSVGAGG